MPTRPSRARSRPRRGAVCEIQHRRVWHIVRMEGQEFLQRGLRIEADFRRVATDDRTAIDATGQLRDAILFECVERADGMFRRVRDVAQRDARALARGLEVGAEVRCAWLGHRPK